MFIRYSLVLSMFIFSSCTITDMWMSPDKTDTGTIIQTGTMSTSNIDYQPPLIENLSGANNEYNPIFDGMETKVIHIKHTSGTPTTVAFINSQAKAVDVSITFPNASGANLRWSQVVLPDGTMDGPFGQKVGYNLRQFGGYEFIFNENMMAGDPWSGEADITFTLRDKAYDTDVLILN